MDKYVLLEHLDPAYLSTTVTASDLASCEKLAEAYKEQALKKNKQLIAVEKEVLATKESAKLLPAERKSEHIRSQEFLTETKDKLSLTQGELGASKRNLIETEESLTGTREKLALAKRERAQSFESDDCKKARREEGRDFGNEAV